MISIHNIWNKFDIFFKKFYPLIWSSSVTAILFTAFLHYELKHNCCDLIYWKNLGKSCFDKWDLYVLSILLSLFLLKVFFFAFLIRPNLRILVRYGELSELEVKKRYADFLFIRLISEIDKIEAKHLRSNIQANDVIALRNFILAHDDMQKSIANFRKDARKLLTPSEIEESTPAEDIYGIIDEEQQAINCSRFARTNISADVNLIRSLVNS